MNIFFFELTGGSTAKAAPCMFLDADLRSREPTCVELHSHFRFDELFEPENVNATKDRLRSGRLTMKPFAEKPIYFILYQVRGE